MEAEYFSRSGTRDRLNLDQPFRNLEVCDPITHPLQDIIVLQEPAFSRNHERDRYLS